MSPYVPLETTQEKITELREPVSTNSALACENSPRWWCPASWLGSDWAAAEIGPNTPELRRRCELLHHGLDSRIQPNTSTRRDEPLRPASFPRTFYGSSLRLTTGSYCLSLTVEREPW